MMRESLSFSSSLKLSLIEPCKGVGLPGKGEGLPCVCVRTRERG